MVIAIQFRRLNRAKSINDLARLAQPNFVVLVVVVIFVRIQTKGAFKIVSFAAHFIPTDLAFGAAAPIPGPAGAQLRRRKPLRFMPVGPRRELVPVCEQRCI